MADAANNEFHIDKLDKDYATWAVLFQASLEDKELWEAIDEPQPDADEDPTGAAAWKKKDKRAFGRLKMSVAMHHLPTIQHCGSAREAWDALAAVFTAQNNARRLQLTKELADLKIRAGESLVAFQGRAKTLQTEMTGAGHPIDDNTIIIHFLNGIRPDYELEMKLITNQQTDMRWDNVMPMLFPVESAKTEKAAAAEAKEGPAAAAYAALLAALPGAAGIAGSGGPPAAAAYAALLAALPKAPPRLSRKERRKRVTCWTCNMKGHYQSQCPQNPDRPSGSGGGPSASFMATAKRLGTPSGMGGAGDGLASPGAMASAAGSNEVRPPSDHWLIDSGASTNMQVVRSGFTTFEDAESEVTIANGHTVRSSGHGSVSLATSLGGVVTLGNTLYVPGITTNLLSVRAMAKKGKVTFEGDDVTVEQDGVLVATGRVNAREQYMLNGSTLSGPSARRPAAPVATAAAAYGQAAPKGHLWHRRLAHLGNANVAKLAKLVDGMDLAATDAKVTDHVSCEPCIGARLTRRPHEGEMRAAAEVLEVVHVDLIGPFEPSQGGAQHVMSALDDYSEMGFASPIKHKSDAGAALRDWIIHLQRQTGTKVKIIRCDGAGELTTDAAMTAFLKETGIRIEPSAPYTPQMNGKAERLNRTVVERLRAVLLESRVDKRMWAEVLMAVHFVRNRSPTADGKATPFERFYGRKPDISRLRVLGSKVYCLRPPKSADKLAAKTHLGRLVGYAAGGHAYRVQSSTTGKVLIRRDVEVIETAPPQSVSPSALPACLYLPDDWTSQSSVSDGDSNGVDGGGRGASGAAAVTGDATLGCATNTVEPVTPSHGYSLRSRPIEMKPGLPAVKPTAQLASTGVPRQAAAASTTVLEVVAQPQRCTTPPETRAEALARPEARLWQEAMDAEYASLSSANAWKLTLLPPGAKVTGGRWVFDVKRDANGAITRHKARYVAQGFTQRMGIDYTDVWAPCPARATVRAVLSLVAAQDLEMHVVDIKTAYLNAPMDLPVYVKQPEGYEQGPPGTVALLRRALYGCKQAGRLWGEHVHKTLTAAGAERSTADPTLYVWRHPAAGTIFIVIHVDDMAIVSKTAKGIAAAKAVILATYAGRDLGAAETFLGMRIARDRAAGTLFLSCPGVTIALLDNFGMMTAKPNKIPMPAGTALRRTGENLLPVGERYAELVGSLLYLSTTTRPDIGYAAGLLARFMTCPETDHWQAAKGVLRYLAGTADIGLVYRNGGGLVGAVDADYDGCLETRRSTTGWVFTWNGAAISWASKRQPTVSSSTAEAEYVAAAAATREAIWLRKLMADLGEEVAAIPMAEDNQACLALIANPETTGRAKHIDVAHHLVRERAAMGEVAFHYTPGDEMVADGLTKPLPGPAFAEFRDHLGVHEPPPPGAGLRAGTETPTSSETVPRPPPHGTLSAGGIRPAVVAAAALAGDRGTAVGEC